MDQYEKPVVMDRQLDVLHCHRDGGLLLGASSLTGRYWLGSLWYYQTPEQAPDVDRCTAGVQLEAGIRDAKWVDDTHVLVALDTGGVAVWSLVDDYRTFVLSFATPGHDDVASSVSVVCDHSKAVSGGFDQSIKVWDLSNLSLLTSAQAHTDLISNVDCHPSESDLFVSCGQDGKLFLWDKRKARPATPISNPLLQHNPSCVRWHPSDRNKMAVGSEGGEISLIDIRKGVDNYLKLAPHDRLVYSVEFCPSKPSLLASVSEDCTAVVTSIDDEAMKQIYSNGSHQDFVHGLTWSTDSQLLTCGWDARVISHDTQTKTSRVLGGATVPATQVNGTVSSLDEKGGFGDAGKGGKCGKPSYSDAVLQQSAQNIII